MMDANTVNSVINNICDKLGVAASVAIPELAKVKIIDAGVWMIISVIVIAIALPCLRILIRRMKNKEYDDIDLEAVYWFAVLVFLIAFSIVFFINLTDFLKWSIAPTGQMIAYVLEAIGD